MVIVNTTIAGAFVRALDLPLEELEAAYREIGFEGDFAAAHEAHDEVRVREVVAEPEPAGEEKVTAESPPVIAITDHREGREPLLKTGSWRTQRPRYVLHLAPCSGWCPAGNDVIGFVQALGARGELAAAEILGRTTPLSGVCGRVCPAPCMEACNRNAKEGPVNVRGLERWVADHAPVANNDIRFQEHPRHVAVVGGGPAGLSAAYELVREGHRVTIFEGEDELGGVLRTGIPSFRLSRDVLDQEIADIVDLGVEVRCGERVDGARLADLTVETTG